MCDGERRERARGASARARLRTFYEHSLKSIYELLKSLSVWAKLEQHVWQLKIFLHQWSVGRFYFGLASIQWLLQACQIFSSVKVTLHVRFRTPTLHTLFLQFIFLPSTMKICQSLILRSATFLRDTASKQNLKLKVKSHWKIGRVNEPYWTGGIRNSRPRTRMHL